MLKSWDLKIPFRSPIIMLSACLLPCMNHLHHEKQIMDGLNYGFFRWLLDQHKGSRASKTGHFYSVYVNYCGMPLQSHEGLCISCFCTLTTNVPTSMQLGNIFAQYSIEIMPFWSSYYLLRNLTSSWTLMRFVL